MKEIIQTIYDDIYPKLTDNEYVREAVRGIVLDENNNILLIHIKCDDMFGHRDHYELPGGGVEDGETYEACFKREIKEETGYDTNIISILGEITIEYHLLKRFDKQIYIIGKVKSFFGTTLTKNEKTLFNEMIRVNINDIEKFYEEHVTTGVGSMIHKRDLSAILYYKKKS